MNSKSLSSRQDSYEKGNVSQGCVRVCVCAKRMGDMAVYVKSMFHCKAEEKNRLQLQQYDELKLDWCEAIENDPHCRSNWLPRTSERPTHKNAAAAASAIHIILLCRGGCAWLNHRMQVEDLHSSTSIDIHSAKKNCCCCYCQPSIESQHFPSTVGPICVGIGDLKRATVDASFAYGQSMPYKRLLVYLMTMQD